MSFVYIWYTKLPSYPGSLKTTYFNSTRNDGKLFTKFLSAFTIFFFYNVFNVFQKSLFNENKSNEARIRFYIRQLDRANRINLTK